MYQITSNKNDRRVEVDFIGSYADIDEADMNRALRQAALTVKGNGSHFDMLCDFTRAPVMPQDRTDNAREQIEWCLANGLRRSANILSSAISKMQVERLSADEHFQSFNSREDALAWLNSA